MIKRVLTKLLKRGQSLTPEQNRKNVGVILAFCSIGVFLLFSFRMMYLTSEDAKVAGVSISKSKKEQHEGAEIVKASRGYILDRHHNVLVTNTKQFSIYAVLDENYVGIDNEKLFVQKKDYAGVAEILHHILDLDQDYVLNQLSINTDSADSPVMNIEFGRKGKSLTLLQKNEIEKALQKKRIKGIYFYETQSREYPLENSASYILGYTSFNKNGELAGEIGIEKDYNDILKGKDGYWKYERDSFGRPVPGTVTEKKTTDGKTIVTTLDDRLQTYLETLLTEVNKTYELESLSFIIGDVKTGEILAASQLPSFNPQTREGLGEKGSTWFNLLTQEAIEPGSTMKVFTLASAVENKVFSEEERFASGSLTIGDTTIRDWNQGVGIGEITFKEGFAWSSNVGMVILEERMADEFQQMIQSFGFLKPTHAVLSSEATGDIQNGTKIDRAMNAYGQALSVTPVQMFQALTAIGNDGKMSAPHFIKAIEDGEKSELIEPKIIANPVSKATANKVLNYMEAVVEHENGTGTMFAVDGIKIAAKTGTAEYIEDGKYAKNKYIHSVVEIFPSDNPEYALYMTLKNPKLEGKSGSEILAEVTNRIVKDTVANDF